MNELEYQDVLRGKLMAMLLARGVRRQDIDTAVLVDPDHPRDDFNHLVIDMFIWLRDEGFIRYASMHRGQSGRPVFNVVSPTARAMQLLDERVEGETTGRDIVQAGDGGDNSWWGKFGAMVGGFVGGFTQSLG